MSEVPLKEANDVTVERGRMEPRPNSSKTTQTCRGLLKIVGKFWGALSSKHGTYQAVKAIR
jgi:hypothetical protein